jgi:dihydroorotase
VCRAEEKQDVSEIEWLGASIGQPSDHLRLRPLVSDNLPEDNWEKPILIHPQHKRIRNAAVVITIAAVFGGDDVLPHSQRSDAENRLAACIQSRAAQNCRPIFEHNAAGKAAGGWPGE